MLGVIHPAHVSCTKTADRQASESVRTKYNRWTERLDRPGSRTAIYLLRYDYAARWRDVTVVLPEPVVVLQNIEDERTRIFRVALTVLGVAAIAIAD